MPLVPNDWNVVVIGHWNRAILSPAGIAKHLLNLPDGTPVQVLVPLDVVAPYHIRHDNVTVIPSNDRLIVQPIHDTIENLVEAIAIVRRALEDLPRTPVFAAGLNLKYKSSDPVGALQQAVANPWDDNLSSKKLVITSRSVARSVSWRDGKINATITEEQNGACSVHLNFDYRSQDSERLCQWLEVPGDDIRRQADLILLGTIRLSPEDFGNG